MTIATKIIFIAALILSIIIPFGYYLIGEKNKKRYKRTIIKMLEKLNRLKILISTILVWDPLSVLLSIIKIKHGCHCIDTQSVHMEMLDRSLLGDVLSEVVTDNNSTLTDQISKTVTSDILREMDDLFQAKERREEEHFRKLDSLIRQQQANRRESAKGNAVIRLKKIFT